MVNDRHVLGQLLGRRAIRPVIAVIVPVIVMGTLATSGGAFAAEQPEDSSLTWSVRPTPTDAAPERPNFMVDVEPGDTVTDSIRVRNYGDESLPLAIYASDALVTESGALDLLPADEQPVNVGAWITLDPEVARSVEVPAQDFVDVPFMIQVPDNAESGDHTGGIVTSFATDTTSEGEPVVLDRRLGSRVQLRVAGELAPSLQIADLAADYSVGLNPFQAGDLDVSYTADNVGNMRLSAYQLVTTEGVLGLGAAETVPNPVPELLPDNSLNLSVETDDVWPLFRTTVTVRLNPVPTREGDVLDPNATATSASVTVWTVPWAQLAVLALLVGGFFAGRTRRRRRGRQEDERVARAVQEALAERDQAPEPEPEPEPEVVSGDAPS
jgi:hypothetical protein